MTNTGETVSIKTNISGSKVCPQIIGQVSLEQFNKKTNSNIRSKDHYKQVVIEEPGKIITMYLHYLFCCKHLLSFNLSRGEIVYLKKIGEININLSEFKYTKTIETWNESNTMHIKIGDKYYTLAEFQVHNNRNCIKCRFNFDTLLLMIEKGYITNAVIEKYKTKNFYNIKVNKNVMDID